MTFNVVKKYLQYVGGVLQLVATNLTLCIFMGFKIGGDYLLGDWSVSPDQQSRFGFFCGLYFLILVLQSCFVYLRVPSLTYFSFKGTKTLHEDMVDRVLKAPCNSYFDRSSLSGILNHFSKDLSVIESTLVFEIGSGYVSFYNLLCVFVIAAFVVPWILLFLPPVLLVSVYLYRHSIAATKETLRIE